MDNPKSKKFIKYNQDGTYDDAEVCTGYGDFKHLHDEYDELDSEDQPHDDCPVCDKNLYYTRNITKRIAILDKQKNVSGWVCPSCFTEFDNKDKIIVLMTQSSIQGKA